MYSSNDAAGTTAWDGVTSPFYITSSACVNGCWQTVQIQSGTSSLFNVYGIFSLGDSSSTSTVTVAANANVSITGSAGINGTVSQGSSCSFTAPTAINANCRKHSTGQLTSSNLCSGGNLCQTQQPIVYPKTSDCCRNAFGCSASTTDSVAYSTCQAHSCNTSCVYHYTSTANSSTINTTNCCKPAAAAERHLTTTAGQTLTSSPGLTLPTTGGGGRTRRSRFRR